MLFFFVQIEDGYLQFRFNLGSGDATARQTTIQVDDNTKHTIIVERKEQSVTLVIDNSYVARATSPGDSDTLDFPSDRVYLGANVDDDGKIRNGFSGCISGAKLNHKDLQDFDARLSMGVELGCALNTPTTGGAFPTVVSIAAGGVGFFVLIIALPAGLIICAVGSYLYQRRKKKGRYRPRTRQATLGSPSFNWEPAHRMQTAGDSQQRLMLTQSSQISAPDLRDLNHHHEGDSLFSLSTPAISEHVFRTPDQTPEQPTRRQHRQEPSSQQLQEHRDERREQEDQQQRITQSNHHLRRQQLLEQQHQKQQQQQQQGQRQHIQQSHPSQQQSRDNAGPVLPLAVPKPEKQQSKEVSSSASPPASRRHVRSPSGHQSIMTIMTTATERSEAATERSEAASVFDDTEVGHYVLKRIEAANADIDSHEKDEMRPFKEEGEFEPLGSVGSLYDILREADENYGPLEHTATPTSRPPVKPKPELATLPNPPTQPRTAPSAIDGPATKQTKLQPKDPKQLKQPDRSNQKLPSKEGEQPTSKHAKANGLPPQPVEKASRPRAKRAARSKRPVAAQAGESLMEKFQNLTSSPPNSEEWDEGKLV